MRRSALLIPVLLLAAAALPAARPAKAKPAPKPSVAALQAQVKALSAERDDLAGRLAALQSLQEDLAAAQRSRDLARQECDNLRKQLEQIKGALAENQGSADSLLQDLQKAKAAAAAGQARVTELEAEKADLQARLATASASAPQAVSAEIIPAKAMNLGRIAPKARKASGVVVVNVLVSENGEVLDVRLLQPLPGEGEAQKAAHEACLEAAKRIVFDPARSADGRTKVRVWQGVGFYLD